MYIFPISSIVPHFMVSGTLDYCEISNEDISKHKISVSMWKKISQFFFTSEAKMIFQKKCISTEIEVS